MNFLDLAYKMGTMEQLFPIRPKSAVPSYISRKIWAHGKKFSTSAQNSCIYGLIILLAWAFREKIPFSAQTLKVSKLHQKISHKKMGKICSLLDRWLEEVIYFVSTYHSLDYFLGLWCAKVIFLGSLLRCLDYFLGLWCAKIIFWGSLLRCYNHWPSDSCSPRGSCDPARRR